jgi:hypothetical protein
MGKRKLKFRERNIKCIIIVFCFFLASCNSESKRRGNEIVEADTTLPEEAYPGQIKKLNLEALFDKTKWTIYCIYCDDTVKFEKSTGITDIITFASLDLRFDTIHQFNDTTEIILSFYFRDTIKCEFGTVRNLGLVTGVGFIKGYDSIYYYTTSSTMRRFWVKGSSSRYTNPLQPEVVEYIKINKEKLHPWFYSEAKKRGLLNSN